jgi:hypothetical protein
MSALGDFQDICERERVRVNVFEEYHSLGDFQGIGERESVCE